VRKFFSGYKIKPEGVSFIMHADGRPTGMAFIEFETPQEAVRAMVSVGNGLNATRCLLGARMAFCCSWWSARGWELCLGCRTLCREG
jgi:hypothetical protein